MVAYLKKENITTLDKVIITHPHADHLGGMIGVGLGLLVGWAANPSITEALGLGENSLLIFVWWQLAILVLSLVVIAIVAGWFPARKASRLDPIEALRTE